MAVLSGKLMLIKLAKKTKSSYTDLGIEEDGALEERLEVPDLSSQVFMHNGIQVHSSLLQTGLQGGQLTSLLVAENRNKLTPVSLNLF